MNLDETERLRFILDELNSNGPSWLSPCDIGCWHGVVVEPDGDGPWLCPPTGPQQMRLPCSLCGKESVSVWQQDRAWGFNTLWLCVPHEHAFYTLLGEFNARRLQ